MSSKIIFLRHADTQKDPNLNASFWSLSELGNSQAQNIISNPVFHDVTRAYVSSEIKTYLTIEPLIQKFEIIVEKNADLDEVHRGDKFLSKEDFEKEKYKQLEDLDYPAFGGETGNQALERFQKAVEKIKSESQNQNILIVTHGTILNIYLAKVLGKFDDITTRWKNTGFCSYAVFKNGVLIKDLIS